MTTAGPVLEVDKGTVPVNGSRVASSVAAGFQRGAVSASLAAVLTYYVNLTLANMNAVPPAEVSFHLNILVTALSVGGMTALGKWLRNKGIETVV